MRIVVATLLAAAGLTAALPAVAAAQQYDPHKDPVRVRNADSRQRASEPKGIESRRNTRCKIIPRRGQDKRVCGVPTNRSPGDGRPR